MWKGPIQNNWEEGSDEECTYIVNRNGVQSDFQLQCRGLIFKGNNLRRRKACLCLTHLGGEEAGGHQVSSKAGLFVGRVGCGLLMNGGTSEDSECSTTTSNTGRRGKTGNKS